MDLRKRWNDLVGKSENEAVSAIKQDGKRSFDIEIQLIIDEFCFFINIGEKNIEVVNEGTPESRAAIKSGVVRVILDENGNVKYPPLRQD
jgi:hypothetical protein